MVMVRRGVRSLALFCALVVGLVAAKTDLVVKLGQVVPRSFNEEDGSDASDACDKHWHGARLAVEKINALNGGKGFAVGYGSTHYVQFDHVVRRIDKTSVSSTGATTEAIEGATYANYHSGNASELAKQVDFWVGTCSGQSGNERDAVNDAGKVMLAQVGPSDYYNPATHKNIFGMHLSSYTYTYPALSSFALSVSNSSKLTVGIAGREKSAFFKTTCSYAKQYAESQGMRVVLYETFDGKTNDVEYQRSLAKRIADTKPDVLVGCIGDPEANVWLKVFRAEEYQAKGGFLTCTGWGWPQRVYNGAVASDVISSGAYIENVVNTNDVRGLHPHDGHFWIGAGQWTDVMSDEKNPAAYTDDVVGGSQSFEAAYKAMGFAEEFTYDSIASYTIPYVYMKNLQTYLKTRDVTDSFLASMLSSASTYEEIRRYLAGLNIRKSIYGPISFDEVQQNNGRRPGNMYSVPKEGGWGELKTSAPDEVRDVIVQYPSPGAAKCARDHVKLADKRNACLLCDVCVPCSDEVQFVVEPCDQKEGTRKVVFRWKNPGMLRCSADAALPTYSTTLECDYLTLENSTMLVFSILHGILIAFFCALIIWTLRYRRYTLLRISQYKMLILMLVGCSIANLQFVFWGTMTTAACMLQPLFMAGGLTLSFGAILIRTFKSWRLFDNPSLKKLKMGFWWTISRVAALFCFEVAVIFIWWAVDPLTPTVTEDSLPGYKGAGTVVRERCASDSSVFETILVFSFAIMIIAGTYLAFKTRKAPSAFKENFFIVICMITCMFCAVILYPAGASISNDPHFSQAIVSIGVMISTLSFALAIIIPKVYVVIKGKGNLDIRVMLSKGARTSATYSGTAQTSSDLANDQNINRQVTKELSYFKSNSFGSDGGKKSPKKKNTSGLSVELSNIKNPIALPRVSGKMAKTSPSSRPAEESMTSTSTTTIGEV